MKAVVILHNASAYLNPLAEDPNWMLACNLVLKLFEIHLFSSCKLVVVWPVLGIRKEQSFCLRTTALYVKFVI